MDVVYFELNNWWYGADYPANEKFYTWVGNNKDESWHMYFEDEKWVRKNQLCVVSEIIDMSNNWCITAPRRWVLDNCPELLTDWKKFLRFLDWDGKVYGKFGTEFLEWKEENVGIVSRYGDGEDE